MKYMDKKFIEQLKQKLEERRVSIEKELGKFAKKDSNMEGDWDSVFPKFNHGDIEEAADEVEEYTSRLSVEFSLENKLRDIKIALKKIEKGCYGVCEECEKHISKERLKVYPEARTCAKCQK